MKKVLLVLVCLICFGVSGQGCVDVKLKYQKASLFCWAASIEMIANYHGVTTYQGQPLTQCKLAQILSGDMGTGAPINSVQLNECEKDTFHLRTFEVPPYPSSSINWNIDYQPSYGLGSSQVLDYVFSKIGFYSVQDSSPLDWELISREITNCRPYIMTIALPGDIYNSHAVVVKGYWHYVDSLNVTTRFIVVADPWYPGSGEVYSLNFDRLQESCNFFVFGEFVHGIRPKNKFYCSLCSEDKIKKSCSDKDKIIMDEFNESAQRKNDRIAFLNGTSTKVYAIKVHYLSYNRLAVDFNGQAVEHLTVEEVQSCSDNLIDIISEDKASAVLYQKTQNNNWQLVKIGKNSYPESIKIKLGGNGFTLSNNPSIQNQQAIISYEYVRYDAFHLNYFRFKKDGKSYLVPEKKKLQLEHFVDQAIEENIELSKISKLRKKIRQTE
jgi:hypothetical protein